MEFLDKLHATQAKFGLTYRQCVVLGQVVVGKCNKEIQKELRIAPRTVELHLTAIMQKTGCQSRGELIAYFWMDKLGAQTRGEHS